MIARLVCRLNRRMLHAAGVQDLLHTRSAVAFQRKKCAVQLLPHGESVTDCHHRMHGTSLCAALCCALKNRAGQCAAAMAYTFTFDRQCFHVVPHACNHTVRCGHEQGIARLYNFFQCIKAMRPCKLCCLLGVSAGSAEVSRDRNTALGK